MRKRKIIITVLIMLLLGGVGTLFLSRDSGATVRVSGNLSSKDVTAIKSATRHRLWRDVFPGFSKQTIEALPGAVKGAWSARMVFISGDGHKAMAWLNGPIYFAVPGFGPVRTNLQGTYVLELTNGPVGWMAGQIMVARTEISVP